jgi:hypothetical protein
MRNRCIVLGICATSLLGSAAPAVASDLSYTFIEFGSIVAESSVPGTQEAGLQTVSLTPEDGDGIVIGGSLAIANHFYIAGSYHAAVISTDAVISSPLATTTVAGSFDWSTSRVAFGGIVPIGDRVDLVFELGQRSVHFDFGSFAGENFDTSDTAAELTAGIRFNPTPSLELAIAAVSSGVGEVDLSTRTFDKGSRATAALRWYVFEDIGLGLDVATGDVEYLGGSIRFGFGDLRAGN